MSTYNCYSFILTLTLLQRNNTGVPYTSCPLTIYYIANFVGDFFINFFSTFLTTILKWNVTKMVMARELGHIHSTVP